MKNPGFKAEFIGVIFVNTDLRLFLLRFVRLRYAYHSYTIIVTCSIINRSHPFAIIVGYWLARFDFIACLATTLVIGSSIAHVEIDGSANSENFSDAFGRTAVVPTPGIDRRVRQPGQAQHRRLLQAELHIRR